MERVFVWLGGGLFVASLAYCAYAYLFVWAEPAPVFDALASNDLLRDLGPTLSRRLSIATNVVLFGVFAIHHSLFARERIKAWTLSLAPVRVQRSIYVWAASLLFLLVCASWAMIGGDLYDVRGWRAYAHGCVQLAGVALIAGAVRTIDPLELAGIRQRSRNSTLQIAGPYRWVRHPLYLGWMMAVFGAAHMTADRLLFAVISSLYLVIAIPWEERSLAREFPDDYAAYRQQVRWRVVPYVY